MLLHHGRAAIVRQTRHSTDQRGNSLRRARAISFFRRSRNCTVISAACGAERGRERLPLRARNNKNGMETNYKFLIQDEQDLAPRRPVIYPRLGTF